MCIKKILFAGSVVAFMTTLSCTGYVDTYRSYSADTAQIARSESESAKAYYDLQARIFEQQTKLKIAAIESAGKNSGGTVIFIGDSGIDTKPIQRNTVLSAPDSAPGLKYAVEGVKTLATGATAVLRDGEIFRTIRSMSGVVSNVSNTMTANRTNTNTESNQANVTNTDNSVTDSFKKTETETNTVTEDNSILHENSYNQTDGNHDNDNSDNSDNSDQSDNSDNSNNSDNSVVRPEVISPTVIQPVIYPPIDTVTQ